MEPFRHLSATFGFIAVELLLQGLVDAPTQGYLSQPVRSGADLVYGSDPQAGDAAFSSALAEDWDWATDWAWAYGFQLADGEPLERTREGVESSRAVYLLRHVQSESSELAG